MQTAAEIDCPEDKHYLEAELNDLVTDSQIWQFIRAGSLDGIWYWDLESPSNEWMSPEFWELLGIDPATRAHDPAEWQDLIHPGDLTVALENFEKHCADPDHPYDQVVRYRHADGSTVWVRCRGLAIRDTNGKAIRMLGAHNDMTAVKLAEQAAQREKMIATRANEDLQTFAYATSHDLKSPANTVRMLLSEVLLAMDEGDIGDARQLVEKAAETTEAMRGLVDDLLGYTRLIGAVAPQSCVDLDDLLQSVVRNLEGDLSSLGAKVRIAPIGQVQGCAWQLKQMFQNLVSNGIKFQAPGNAPIVDIHATRHEEGRITIHVTDNGIGVSPADQERIFDIFSKLHRPSDYQGSGIGLAICNRVAEAHGSRIQLVSEPGKGCTFSVSLSLSEEQTCPR